MIQHLSESNFGLSLWILLGVCLSENPWRMPCQPFEGAAVIATIKRIMVKTSACAAELRPTHQPKRPKRDSSVKFTEVLWPCACEAWSLTKSIIQSKARQLWTYTRYRSGHRPYSSSLRLQPTWHHTRHLCSSCSLDKVRSLIQPVRWCLGVIWVHVHVTGCFGWAFILRISPLLQIWTREIDRKECLRV